MIPRVGDPAHCRDRDVDAQYNGSGCAANWGTGEVERNTNSTANVSEDGSGHLNITPVNSGGSWTSGRGR